MTLYRYLAADGTEIEREFPIGEQPDQITARGKAFDLAIPTRFRTEVAREVRYVSRQLCRNHPDAPDHDADGRPRFRSRHEEDEFVARVNHNRGPDDAIESDRPKFRGSSQRLRRGRASRL